MQIVTYIKVIYLVFLGIFMLLQMSVSKILTLIVVYDTSKLPKFYINDFKNDLYCQFICWFEMSASNPFDPTVWEECHFQSCFSICELELLLEYALTPFSFIKALRLKRLGVEMKNNAQNFYRLSAVRILL